MKKILSFFVVLFALSMFMCASATAKSVKPSTAAVLVDNISEGHLAYNINGNNYFKLRDIAKRMSGTNKQFDIKWDSATSSIHILMGKPYTPDGSETDPWYWYDMDFSKYTEAKPTSSNIYLDGVKLDLQAYNINGNNFFKLRDLGEALDFSVEWNYTGKRIEIETIYSYIPDNIEDGYSIRRNVDLARSQQMSVSNWGDVSDVQQFSYMNEGLAYAYLTDTTLEVVMPSRQFSIQKQLPLLGDIIADDDGFIYVVWGQNNLSSSYAMNTVFITKYTPDGQFIKSTGFPGGSVMGDSGNTKEPFRHGNCDSAIGNGMLMVNYARGMYNGHQSNNVLGVYIDSMQPVTFASKWDIPYTSHSFNQRVIWSDRYNNFIYADHGDAYDRGFIITTGKEESNIFHFFLPANSNYNMLVVNKTYAQMGELLETSAGAVFVGASAKSISSAAETEKQNLFIQIFDPTGSGATKFVGGIDRIGATSDDINDKYNKPLVPVTDHGVIWLTDHTDRDVIAPQAVACDDKIVILWSERKDSAQETFYMVLTAYGDIITPATSLGKGYLLNSHEAPIAHEGKVYWTCSSNDRIRVISLDLQ